MNNIKTIPSQLFPRAKCKGISPCSFFALTSTPLLTIFWTMLAYPHEA